MTKAAIHIDHCPVCHAEEVQGDTWKHDPVYPEETARLVHLYYACEPEERKIVRQIAASFSGHAIDSEAAK